MKYKTMEFENRYFIGIEYPGGVQPGSDPKFGQLWDDFLGEDIKLLSDVTHKNKFIGLECYPPDFKETKTFDYYALLETNELVKKDGFSSKKLPKGTYILFEITFDDIRDQIQNVYKYIRENNINIHYGFDYEDYLQEEDYTKSGAVLNFCVKLVDDNE